MPALGGWVQPRANMYYARGLSAVTGVHKSSIMEPGVANREGKGAIKRRTIEKSHSPELCRSA